MKKSELKNGMVIQLRDGLYMMLINGNFRNGRWLIRLEQYNDDLFSTSNGERTKNDKQFDIMKVYTVDTVDIIDTFFTFNNLDNKEHLTLIFERQELPGAS